MEFGNQAKYHRVKFSSSDDVVGQWDGQEGIDPTREKVYTFLVFGEQSKAFKNRVRIVIAENDMQAYSKLKEMTEEENDQIVSSDNAIKYCALLQISEIMAL